MTSATLRRRWLLAAGPALVLSACGFQLRQAPQLVFRSVQVNVAANSALGKELVSSLKAAHNVDVLTEARPSAPAEVILDVLTERHEKVVVGLNSSGQIREFQLRIRLKFKLRTPQGKDLIAETELLQQNDISYTETAALAKETEEALLYRSMQTDLVQQVLRRLAAVRQL